MPNLTIAKNSIIQHNVGKFARLRNTNSITFLLAGNVTVTTDNKDLRMTLTLIFMSFFFIVTTTTTGTYHISKSLVAFGKKGSRG